MKNLSAQDACAWLQSQPDALFVDVGRPPDVVNVPWYEYPGLQRDAGSFAEMVARQATGNDQPLLGYRSGQRTLAAGKGLETAGFSDVQHVVHGFEGELNAQLQRSTVSGWRCAGLL